MKAFLRLAIPVLIGLILHQPGAAEPAPPAPKFYAFCVEEGVKGLAPRPLPEQARLLRELGFNFNVCHWLKTDGAEDYRPLLRAHADKLFCVTLAGAKVGSTTWTDGLIQPLDRGDFDNRALLAVLGEIGYRGPVGLMCYGVPGDPREHLARSMKVWRQLQQPGSKAR